MRGLIFVLAATALSSGVAAAQSIEGAPPVDVIARSNTVPGVRGFSGELQPERLPPVEASCVLRFDISRHGLVDPESIVAECDDEDYVETAIAMITSQTYEPVIVDGEPQAQLGVTTELRFREAG